nr:EpsG family protein [uncultured Mediterraneibacter sp.]
MYIFVLFIILLNGILNGKKRKVFVISSFALIILVAALRKYTVGIDLAEHYASRFTAIANLSWEQIPTFYMIHTYDFGFLIFDKLLGYISDNPQIFIIATSVIIYGSVARYIYRHSENVVMETFLFFTSFTMMMYLNIIAQALAIAILLFALDYLASKKYAMYALIVLLAALIHSSALICLGFIPLTFLPNKRKYIIRYIILLLVLLLGLDEIVNFLTKTVFQQYAYYFESGSYHGSGISISFNSLFQISMHIITILIAVIFMKRGGVFDESRLTISEHRKRSFFSKTYHLSNIPQFTTNFLLYMSISAAVFRILAYQSYIITRMGFYFYFFSFTLLSRATRSIRNASNKRIITGFIYIYMLIMFFIFYKSAGVNSYGVLPYQFFWQ